MAQITIGCRLVQGFTLMIPGHRVTLNGTHTKGAIVFASKDGEQAAVTRVDKDLWDAWVNQVTQYYPPLLRGAIFVYKGEDTLEEATSEKTGLEGFDPENPPEGFENKGSDNAGYRDEVRRESSIARRDEMERDNVPLSLKGTAPTEGKTLTDNSYLQVEASRRHAEMNKVAAAQAAEAAAAAVKTKA